MTLRLIALLAASATLFILGAGKDLPVDSYMPGAKVTLTVELEAPPQWAFNPDVPLRISFEDSALKQANFKVDKESYDFKVKQHQPVYVAEIPIKISSKLTAPKLDVPLQLQCSICTNDNSRCTLVSDDIKFSLSVKSKAAPGDKNEPQKKGKLVSRHLLTAPEV